MRNFYIAIFILGMLLLLGYLPLLIFSGNYLYNYIPQEHKNLFSYFILLSPPIIGFFLIAISAGRFKKSGINKINSELKNAKNIWETNLSVLDQQNNYSFAEVEEIRAKAKRFQTTAIIVLLLGFFLPGFVLIVPGVIASFYFSSQSSKLKAIIKSWVYKNAIKMPNLQDLYYIPKELRKELYTPIFIRKLVLENCHLQSLDIDDVVAFKYENKWVELVDFNLNSGGKNKNYYYYLCLATKNPDKTEGQTAGWSDKKWHFDLPQKVETESIVFDRIFETKATNQIHARIHLKTNVMQDMIDLNQSLATKDTIFYFDQDMMYVIFRGAKNSLEPDLNKSVLQPQKDSSLLQDLQFALRVFDDFWLSRNTF